MHNVLDACISITRASGRGLGPGNRELFGPKLINHWCIGGFMYKSPQGRFQGPYCGGVGEQVHKELNRPARAAPPHYKTS